MRTRFLVAFFVMTATIATAQEISPKTVVLPRVVKEVKAEYTPEARAAKIEGTVWVEVLVQTDGTVAADAKVTRSLDRKFRLDEEAVKASKQWKFRPATKAGSPVAVRITLEHRFKLEP
jgi:protein TonB